MIGVVMAGLGTYAMHHLVGLLEQVVPELGPWLAEHQIAVMSTIYVLFIASWCAFWTSLVLNTRIVVRLDEYRTLHAVREEPERARGA